MDMPEDLEIRLPPQSINCEQSVIGGLMLDNASWVDIQGMLDDADFYRKDHALLFLAVSYLLTKGHPADVVSVSELLERRGKLDDVGGLEYICDIARNTPSSANIKYYAAIVRDKSIKRKLITLAAKLTEDCFSSEDESKTLLAQAETTIFNLTQINAKGKKGFVSVKQSLTAVVEKMEQYYDNKPTSGVLGISTGFYDLDNMTSGFCGGQFWIVAARPGMGKSVFGVNVAEAAARSGYPVAFFSLEMSHDEISQRMLSGASRVGLKLLRQSWTLEEVHWPRITAGMGVISGIPMYIDDTQSLTLSDIRSRSIRLNSELIKENGKGLGMVVIDYLQLMGSDNKRSENRNNEVEQITRGLKSMAKELDIPIIALAQLNRSLEKRPEKKPILSDLRDSGGIEQDADGVIFLYRDEVYHEDSQHKGIADVIIAKQRHGNLGSVRLVFDGDCTSFRNMDRPYSQQNYD